MSIGSPPRSSRFLAWLATLTPQTPKWFVSLTAWLIPLGYVYFAVEYHTKLGQRDTYLRVLGQVFLNFWGLMIVCAVSMQIAGGLFGRRCQHATSSTTTSSSTTQRFHKLVGTPDHTFLIFRSRQAFRTLLLEFFYSTRCMFGVALLAAGPVHAFYYQAHTPRGILLSLDAARRPMGAGGAHLSWAGFPKLGAEELLSWGTMEAWGRSVYEWGVDRRWDWTPTGLTYSILEATKDWHAIPPRSEQSLFAAAFSSGRR